MGLVGQDRGELHTRNRGISRRVTIQWPSHKSGGTASTDRGWEVQEALWCSAGGPTMTRDNGVRTVFTGCTSAAADTWPDTAIGGAEAMSRRSGGSTWSLAVSRQLIYWSIKRVMRCDQPDRTPRLAAA